jgi:hypothetical protein
MDGYGENSHPGTLESGKVHGTERTDERSSPSRILTTPGDRVSFQWKAMYWGYGSPLSVESRRRSWLAVSRCGAGAEAESSGPASRSGRSGDDSDRLEHCRSKCKRRDRGLIPAERMDECRHCRTLRFRSESLQYYNVGWHSSNSHCRLPKPTIPRLQIRSRDGPPPLPIRVQHFGRPRAEIKILCRQLLHAQHHRPAVYRDTLPSFSLPDRYDQMLTQCLWAYGLGAESRSGWVGCVRPSTAVESVRARKQAGRPSLTPCVFFLFSRSGQGEMTAALMSRATDPGRRDPRFTIRNNLRRGLGSAPPREPYQTTKLISRKCTPPFATYPGSGPETHHHCSAYGACRNAPSKESWATLPAVSPRRQHPHVLPRRRDRCDKVRPEKASQNARCNLTVTSALTSGGGWRSTVF